MKHLMFWSILFYSLIGIQCQDVYPNCKEEYYKKPTTYTDREYLGQWLIRGEWSRIKMESLNETYKSVEYPSYDGFYNNLGMPEFGATDTPLLRRAPAAYKDGVYQPIEDGLNPFDLSDEVFNGISQPTLTGKNALIVFFGQQVVEEILDAQRPSCPPEYLHIEIPENHTYKGETNLTKMPFLRTRYDVRTGQSPGNPRQQLNEITPWIDGGLIYGTSRVWSDYLRLFSNGSLATGGQLAFSHHGLFPEYNTHQLPMANPPSPNHHKMFQKNHETLPVTRLFKLGNPRGNENPFLLTFGVLWFRWHNYLAKELERWNPHWTNDQLFNEARKWTIATQQHIVVDEWLPHWIGEELEKYKDYDATINPQIDQLFQGAAFRFGHTLVPSAVYRRTPGGNFTLIRLCNSFWIPEDFIGNKESNEIQDIDGLLVGLALQLCEKEDTTIVEDLRQRVFGPLEFSRRDLMALNIQRGRDHGLPDYISARKAFGLPPPSDEICKKLKKIYNINTKHIDVWVGGMLETTDEGPGELFKKIIKDQFRRIRDGDRFWYQNSANRLFSTKQINRIKQLKFYDIIMATTKLDHLDIQKNAFVVPKKEGEVKTKLVKGKCPKLVNPFKEEIIFDCFHLAKPTIKDTCGNVETYDYFDNSERTFVYTFSGIGIVILVIGCGLLAVLMYKKTDQDPGMLDNKGDNTGVKTLLTNSQFIVFERISKNSTRGVILSLDTRNRQIKILNMSGELLRKLDLGNKNNCIKIFTVTDGEHMMFRMCNDYDLIIKFQSSYLRSYFLKQFEEFIERTDVKREYINISLTAALKQAVTKKDRQRILEKFTRIIFSQNFGLSYSNEIFKMDSQTAKEIIFTELSKSEFADALRMLPDSEFVTKMFNTVDKDKNGFISFREFMDFMIIYVKGSPEEKIKLMFNMWDINGTQELSKEDFKNMIKSQAQLFTDNLDQRQLDEVVDGLMKEAKISHKDTMRQEDLRRVICLQNSPYKARGSTQPSTSTDFSLYYSDIFNLQSNEDEGVEESERIIDIDQENAIKKQDTIKGKQLIFDNTIGKSKTKRNLQNYALEIFWFTLFTLILFAIFAERAYYYSIEREHGGLRQIAGYGVTVTRGAASAIMFCMGGLMVTMCRNFNTFLRDTRAHEWVPFDSSLNFHMYIGCWALFFTVLHTIGHGFNLYFISTQTSDDLTCLFRNFYHASHEIPKFQYWCWGTVTGVTGVILTIMTACLYIFSLPIVRSRFYNLFWAVHYINPIYFGLITLHGSGRLVQSPFFLYFFIGPCILYVLDRIVSVSRKKVEIPVLEAQLLPSGVTLLQIKRPINFEYKSGQWVRVACPMINCNEFHPITFSSAPYESNLTLHIRAVGPWTRKLRDVYDPARIISSEFPKIILDGPYGGSHQDLNQYEVAVLIGGGIGVTPFASILKEIVFHNNSLSKKGICRKVYFIWVTRTQSQFEWFVDIIREIEKTDKNHLVSTHIFITQFFHKFDLRTILLYICERHFQRVSNQSLFTGLRAITHFGRPEFKDFFRSIQNLRPNVRKVGVFSCGPLPLNKAVNKACSQINKDNEQDMAIFQHVSKHF